MNTWMIRIFCTALCFVCVLGSTPESAHADYTMPPFKDGFSKVTHIVDATVEAVDSEHRIAIRVHNVWVGDGSPDQIYGIVYSCLGAWQGWVKPGERYVFFMVKDAAFEEGSKFPVRSSKDGSLYVEWGSFYTKWMSAPKNSMPLNEAKAWVVRRHKETIRLKKKETKTIIQRPAQSAPKR